MVWSSSGINRKMFPSFLFSVLLPSIVFTSVISLTPVEGTDGSGGNVLFCVDSAHTLVYPYRVSEIEADITEAETRVDGLISEAAMVVTERNASVVYDIKFGEVFVRGDEQDTTAEINATLASTLSTLDASRQRALLVSSKVNATCTQLEYDANITTTSFLEWNASVTAAVNAGGNYATTAAAEIASMTEVLASLRGPPVMWKVNTVEVQCNTEMQSHCVQCIGPSLSLTCVGAYANGEGVVYNVSECVDVVALPSIVTTSNFDMVGGESNATVWVYTKPDTRGCCVDSRGVYDCECDAGFAFPTCFDCNSGMYGDYCDQQCPGWVEESGEVCFGNGWCDDGMYGAGNCTCDSDAFGPSCISTFSFQSYLFAEEPQAGLSFGGGQVALSDDGLVLVASVGAGEGAGGYVEVYVRASTTSEFEYVQTLRPIQAGQTEYGRAGIVLAGNMLAVADGGEPGEYTAMGCVYLYERDSVSGGFSLRQKLLPVGVNEGSGFANGTLLMSPNGRTLIVGTPYADMEGQRKGGAVVYTTTSPGSVNYTQSASWAVFDVDGSPQYGWGAAAMSYTGDIIAISTLEGAQAGGTGLVLVRERTGEGSPYLDADTVEGGDAEVGDQFGAAVVLDHLGSLLVVGAPGVDGGYSNSGAVYVFERESNVYVLRQKITAFDKGVGDMLGTTVAMAIDGSFLVVPSPYKRPSRPGQSPYFVYVFQRDTSSVTAQYEVAQPGRLQLGEEGESMGRVFSPTSAGRTSVRLSDDASTLVMGVEGGEYATGGIAVLKAE